MKNIMLFIVLNLFALHICGQDYIHPKVTDPGFQEETTYFIFFNHFWLNAHHVLYNSALNKEGEEMGDLEIINRLSDNSVEDLKVYHDAVAYTSVRPTTHIVMDSKRSPNTEGEWFELLLHEASHNLIKSSTGFIGGTIQNVSDVLEIKPPWQLWHVYLFYITGHTAKKQLGEEGIHNYELYMIREKVFVEHIPLLDKHLLPYLNKEVSLGMATQNLLIEYSENR